LKTSKNSYCIDVNTLETWTKASVVEKIIMPLVVTDRGNEKYRERYSKNNSKKLLQLLLERCTNVLLDRRSIMLYKAGGNLTVTHKEERMGRNPKTGEDKVITARDVATLSKRKNSNGRVSRSDMAEWVYGQLPDVPLKMVKEAVKAVYVLFSGVVAGTYRIEFRDFGIFHPIRRGEKEGRNPKSGEDVYVKETIKIHFKQGRNLRRLLNP